MSHKFHGANQNGSVSLSGQYDINIWYSYDNNTKTAVTTKGFIYNDIMNMTLKNNAKLDSTSEIIVECLRQPSVSDVEISDGKVKVKVNKEMGVEIIGNTTVKVQVEDDEDEYEEILDDENSEELNIDIDKLDDDFLENEEK